MGGCIEVEDGRGAVGALKRSTSPCLGWGQDLERGEKIGEEAKISKLSLEGHRDFGVREEPDENDWKSKSEKYD